MDSAGYNGRNASTYGRDMSTMDTTPSTADVLLGRAKAAILALLFTRADQTFYGREISRLTGLPHGQVPRELARLVRTGLVTRVRRGREVYYQANPESPVFGEVRGLMVKTRGVGDALRDGLLSLGERVEFAMIYGSFARGEEHAGSDVDVLVIGSAGFAETVHALRQARERIGREVNATVFASQEFRTRALADDAFVCEVLARPRIMLIGDEHELVALAT